MSKKKIFIKNSVSGVFQKVIVAILTFFAIPFFITKLGAISYGIFATVSVIGDLSRIANIGFHIALIRYLSIQGKTKESAIDIIVALVSMIILIVPISVLLIIFNEYFLVNVLNIAAVDLVKSKILFNYLVLANMFLFIGLIFSAMLESQRKIYKTNILQLLYSVMYWSLMIISLSFGQGLDGIGLMAFITALVWFSIIMYSAFKEWGKMSTRGIFKLYWRSVKKQLGYGLQVYASGVMGLFGEPLLKVFVANFLGHTYVGFLDIGIRIRNQIGRVFDAALQPLFQLFSETRDILSKSKIVKEIQEKSVLVLLPVSILVIFGAKPIVTMWIGDNINIISTTLIIVTVGSLLGGYIFGGMMHYLGVDKPIILFVNSTITNIIFSSVILFFHKTLGYNSVYLSFILVSIVDIFIMLYLQKKYLNSVIFNKSIQILSLLFYTISVICICFIIATIIHQPIILLIILGFLVPIISIILYIIFSLINEDDVKRYFGESAVSKMFMSLIEILSPYIIMKIPAVNVSDIISPKENKI